MDVENPRRLLPVGLIALVVVGGACSVEPVVEPGTGAPDEGPIEIVYRGQRRLAERRGDLLLIEGDIEVTARDLGRGTRQVVDGVERIEAPLARETGFNAKWPGAVNYSMASVAAADRPVVQAGIALWTAAVPALSFNQLAACSGDCLNFVTLANTNSSPIGRQGGTQNVNLQNGPPAAVVAHEVAHALGVWHEQSRSDRGTFVTINWAQVVGCVNGATSFANCGKAVCEAGPGTPMQNAITNGCCTMAQYMAVPTQCFPAFNFDIGSASPQALMFGYDYDSVMHYPAFGFAKGAQPTITPLMALPAGVVLGQTTHLSDGDLNSMRVLYPTLALSGSLFRSTGTGNLATLAGRGQDIDVRYNCTVNGVMTFSSTVNTANLPSGSVALSCTVMSPLWTLNYVYPNTTNSTWPANGIETFSRSGTLTVMDPGLIAVFARIL
jgi:hypothetical protein